MKTAPLLVLVAMVFGVTTFAHAGSSGDESRIQSPNIIDYLGFSWETGGFPTSSVGDVFNFAAFADGVDPVFGVDLVANELTLYGTDLVSSGQVDLGGGLITVSYTGGTIEIWLDPAKNHVFGTNPPNGTVPSTFTDGSLFLGGSFTSFSVSFDTNNGAGVYQGDLLFTSGSALATVQGIQADGFSFGGILDQSASAGNIPAGWDLLFDGVVEIQVLVSVEEQTWSEVKGLYRR